jgi:hypothetical protein
MKTIVVTHEVKDYSVWRKVYDDDEKNRSKAGFKSNVYRSIESPNKITIIGEAPNLESVKQYMESPQLKEAMERAGVIGNPVINILDKA